MNQSTDKNGDAHLLSFVDYFHDQVTKKKTQELKLMREDYSALLKVEEDKTKILEHDQDTLEGVLKKLKHKHYTDRKQNENEIEGLLNKITTLNQELDNVKLNVRDIKRQKMEIESTRNDILNKLTRIHEEYEKENKNHQVSVIRNDNKKEELKDCKEAQAVLLAEYEERESKLRERVENMKEQVEEAKDTEKKYKEARAKAKQLNHDFKVFKQMNNLDDKEKELLIKTIKDREKLIAELSQIIISKLDPHLDEETVEQLDCIMEQLDKTIERAKNTSHFMNYTRQLQRKQLEIGNF